jgi:drug/metabolite transporter (DMT)-like permease
VSPSIVYALEALLFYGLADFVYKRAAAAGAEPHRFLMVQTWLFNTLALAYGFASGTLVFSGGALWGAVAGVFVAIGYYNFAWSLRHGAVSINAAIFRLSFAVTTTLAVIVLGESLSAAKLAGLLLAVFAVWLLVTAPAAAGDQNAHERRASIVRVVIATIIVGAASFAYKLGVRAGATPISVVVAQGLVALVLFTAFGVYTDRGVRLSRPALAHAPMSAVLLLVAFTSLAKALQGGDVSVVVPIAQMGFVVTAILGFAFQREPLTLRRFAGLAIAVLALTSLAWS